MSEPCTPSRRTAFASMSGGFLRTTPNAPGALRDLGARLLRQMGEPTPQARASSAAQAPTPLR